MTREEQNAIAEEVDAAGGCTALNLISIADTHPDRAVQLLAAVLRGLLLARELEREEWND